MTGLTSRLHRGLAAAALAILLAAPVLLGLGAAPASAAPPTEVLVSMDGVNWESDPSQGIFDGMGLLVPGDSVTSEMWIRNPTALPAVLRVSMRDLIIPSVDFAAGVSMATWDSGTDTTLEKTLGGLAGCDILVPSQAIAPGGTMKLVLTFSMGDMDGLTGQDEAVSLALMVAMRDGEAGPFPASACDDDGVLVPSTGSRPGPGTIARTGTDLPVPLIVAAALLVGVGISLIAGGRRRRDEESA